jgi:hypothetical protein
MFVRVFSLILACACAAPVVAAERPAPVTRPGVVTRDLPAVTPGIVRPGTAFRVAPSDLPRANIVRPENLRPLPTDARPIMPMLPGGPGVRPIVPRPDTGAVRPSPPLARPDLPILRPNPNTRPIDMPRPLPAPIERPVRPGS